MGINAKLKKIYEILAEHADYKNAMTMGCLLTMVLPKLLNLKIYLMTNLLQLLQLINLLLQLIKQLLQFNQSIFR
uniref:Uncharacterized protein n=1 Tax=Acrobeloides nanus TaxID=290746 RepID=A0A914BYC2_9BILA